MGWSAPSDAPMFVIGAAPVFTRSSPGTYVTIMAPGLKPSLRFHSVGSIETPDAFAGIEARSKCTRRPVPLVGSATVKKSFGKGIRHLRVAIGSHRFAVAVSTAGSHEKLAYPSS